MTCKTRFLEVSSSVPGAGLAPSATQDNDGVYMRRAFLQTGLISTLVIAAVLAVPVRAQQQTIIAASRSINWSSAGVAGGIPNRTTICATLSPGVTAAQINSALSSCPAGQVVKLNPGTYNLNAGIDFGGGKSNITLRGAGADQTILVFTNDASCNGAFSSVCLHSNDTNWKGGPSNLVNWTAGYTRGTTSITLASVPNLKVGNPIILDQLDDSCDDGSIVVTDSTSSCSPTGSGVGGPFSLEGNGGGTQRSGRQQMQIVTVTACGGVTTPGASCSGTNVSVTISPGLYMPTWSAAKSPQAWWASSPALYDGLEDVTVDSTSAGTSTASVELFNCANCWVKGVRSIDSGRAHVQIQYSPRATVRDSYFFLTQNSISQSYGVECYASADSLVENNIFQAVATPEMVNGPCSGLVVSYNFSINDYYTGSSGYNLPATNSHTAGIDFVLYEGNVGNQINGDVFHGTHHFVTAFRNRWSGTQPACWASGSPYSSASFGACNNNLSPVELLSFSRFYNMVGNVLGTPGVNGIYETYTGGPSGSAAIFDLGFGNRENSVTVPPDPNVRTTLMRWGNYDTVRNAVTFDPNEVPSSLAGSQAPFSNPVPSSQSLPASFYLSAKPGWWPPAKVWPPIGPDVTGGNIPNVAGHAYTIPAQDCFTTIGGPANGTGPVRTFSASACYGSGGTAPAAPTNLRIVGS